MSWQISLILFVSNILKPQKQAFSIFMATNNGGIRVICIRALKHLIELVSSIRSSTEIGLNEYITKDLEKYEAEIGQLKIIYEEGSHPPNTTLLCKALKSYIDH